MENASNHPEQVQLLSVVQSNLLHGHAHPVEVPHVVEKRVLQSAGLQMLQNTRAGVRKSARRETENV